MENTVTVRDAAERLGVPANTLQSWCERFLPGEAHPGSLQHRWLTPDQLQILEFVKSLRAEARSDDTITRRIQPLLAKPQEHNHRGTPVVVKGGPVPGQDGAARESVLAREHARTAQRISELEERVRRLTLVEQEAHRFHNHYGQELENVRRQLMAAERARVKAETERDQLRETLNSSWWRRLFGSSLFS